MRQSRCCHWCSWASLAGPYSYSPLGTAPALVPVGVAVDVIYTTAALPLSSCTTSLAARIPARWSILEGGWATNAGNMEYSAASFIEGWDEEVLGGHVLGLRCWGHVCSRRRWCWYEGGSGGRDYHHQARHRRFGFVRCGCGCDCKFSRKTLNGGCLPLAVAAEADTVLTRPAEQVE